ncbi:DUF4142 domain-containing protein [Ochrobactrum teleogrylli]|uniref:DUF4142 domain-containing protein n=1 Tax=Ochrobactrum teleogrylli TaxID=2479765 RepID=A0ABY2XYU9_9HYPH|nr:DUF4142 domain-containing protein [[Ochrobactrum] teleogrylli]TNV10127.1 DUF4142 domain-containing protein [[Ochrobactrum] teleogrylli]
MNIRATLFAVTALTFATVSLAEARDVKLSDPEIAHVAYTAGVIDAAAGKQALQKSKNRAVRDFAKTMIRDHEAVNVQALNLVKKLNVTPQDNDISKALSKAAQSKLAQLKKLRGKAFDKAYVQNEVDYHKQVNGALETTLIPNASNGELKELLKTGLKLFKSHQMHAEKLNASLR